MIKLTGAIFLIISSFILGIYISKKRMNYINFLREYIKFILNFETEIKYSRKTPIQILKEYNSGIYMENYINKCIKFCEKYTFSDAWNLTFSDLKTFFCISKEEQNFIKNFGSQIGTSDIEGQINYCDYNINITKSYLEQALQNKEKNQKLPIILSLSAGFLLIIIFI